LFAWLLWLAGRVLVPRWQGALVVAVLGGSLALLLSVPLFPSSGSVWPVLAVGGLALAAYLLGLVPPLQRLTREKQLDASGANEWFTLLGTAAFALILALGLAAYRAADGTSVALVLSQLSVLASVAAVPILGSGLTVMRATSDSKDMAPYRMAGTWVALVGAIVMLAALAMAWPRPVPVVLVGTLSAIVLATAAIRFRLPAIHAGAIACLAVVYLTGYHLISDLIAGTPPGQRGGVEALRLIFEAQSGAALAGLLVIFGGLFVWLEHRGLRRHSIMYAGGCLVTAVVSLLTVTAHGLTHRADPDLIMAMGIYAVYGIGSLALAARLRRPMPAYLGLGLLVGASVWALGWRTEQIGMPWATVLSAEALGMGLLGTLLWRPSRRMLAAAETSDDTPVPSEAVGMPRTFRLPLLHMGEIVAILALVLGVGSAVYYRAAIAETATLLPVLTGAFVVATYLLLAWAHQSAERTWIASTVGLLGLIHTMGFNFIGVDGQRWVEQPWLVALLTHATLGVVAGAVMELWGKRGQLKGPQEKVLAAVRRVLVEPLSQGALITSAAALPVLLVSQWNETLAMAGCLFWLAAIWLVVAVMNRSAALFALHQGILCVATVVGMVAWLQRIDVVATLPNHLFVLRCLQACGIGLGLLVLFWTTARILLRGNALAQTLLQPSWPTVDWFLRHGLVGGQLLLVGCYMLLGCGAELWSTGDVTTRVLAATSGWAWLLLAVSSSGLIVALWQRAGTGEMVNGLLLAAVVPCLVAGRFAPDLATATALRWGLAMGYLIVSVAFWQRRGVGAWLTQAGVRPKMIAESPRIGRGVLLAVTGVPVLIITLVAALLQMTGSNPIGPVAESFFDNMGPTWAYVLPLVLVMGTMVGHALRETSAGYAFFAGLVAEMIVVLGYVLGVVTDSTRSFGTVELVTVLQLATIMAAVWAIGWMALRRWTTAWSQRGSTSTARVLMDVQLSFASLGNLVLLVPALFILAFSFGHVQTWTQAAGGPLGWLALLTAVGAGAYRQIQSGGRLRPEWAGLFGMAVLGLAACSVHGLSETLQYDPVWGYRTLMLGWALYSLFVALATWWVATQRTLPGAAGPPQALIRAASTWVTTAGLLAVLLGLNAAIWHQEQLWAASAIAVASIAGAAMAVWRRREEWALAAGAGVNLAASLVVWHLHWGMDFSEWWTLLVQANVIASSAVALIWLSARRRLYQLRDLSLGDSPMLGFQTALGTLGNFVLLFVPVVCLVVDPSGLPRWAQALADPPGWIALLLAGAAAAWYLRQVLPGSLPDIAAGFGLGLGVLLACGSERLELASVPKGYLAYHVLTASWTALAAALLAVGWFCRNLKLTGTADAAPRRIAPAAAVRNWVSLVGGLALFLAVINSAGDPSGPWWSVGVVLALSAIVGGLAVGYKMPSYVYLSGLLINTAGMIAWWSNPWTGATFTGFVQINALCLAVGSAIWSVVHLLRPTDRGELPFAHLAIRVALAALGLLVAGGFFCDLARVEHAVGNRAGWLALAAVALAMTICLWDRSSRFSLPGLYVVALTAVGMGLVARDFNPNEFCWVATIELGAFVRATTLLGEFLRQARPLARAMLIP
ncbi:MAG: hypothetical protein HQ581_14380, partial [Planctomycetes bacterium]|nr:hypothetical protein [Planctomycetota bacterium]